jgi:glycosyltransferase A (GT-A) superfamily protein (DUF2064 family)
MGQETPDGATSVAIAIVCSTPVEDGRGRTGLSPPLSPEEVTALCGCFVADMAATISGLCGELPVYGVAVAPSGGEDAMRKSLPERFATLSRRGDTAAEWHAGVVEDLLAAGHGAVCLLTASSPTLPEALLRQAIEAVLRPGERLVLAPAVGGRCALIGVRRFVPELFRGLAWGTSRTLREITDRASSLSLPVEALNVWYDVADGLALNWLVRELLGDGAFPLGNGLAGASAPLTRARLALLAGRGYGPTLHPDLPVKAVGDAT